MLHWPWDQFDSWALPGACSLVRGWIVFDDVQSQLVARFTLQPVLVHLQRDISVAVLGFLGRVSRVSL